MIRSFLERVGVYGYEYAHERAMLASLLTGTPLLMIGHIGEAKTRAAEAMAELLLGTPEEGEPKQFQKIAAYKAQFEDMVGFPNFKNMQDGKGEIEYAQTPISIMNKKFILIDEISRCNPQLQNKFLEVVLERQVMGIPTDIQWVWCTMNPLEYAGSQPLDGALAGRMGYIINVKQMINQPETTIRKVASSRNYAQTPALAYWTSDKRKYVSIATDDLRNELKDLLYRAGTILEGLEDNWTSVVADYIAKFAVTLKTQSGLVIDGRRAVMIRYNIISNIAIQTVQEGRALSILELQNLCKEVVLLSLTWAATGLKDTIDIVKVKKAHDTAMGALNNSDHLLYQIVTEQDALAKVQLYLDNKNRIDSSSATNLIASIYDPVHPMETREETWAAQAQRFAIKLSLTQIMLNNSNVPSEILGIVGKQYPLNFDKRSMKQNLHTKIAITNYVQTQELAKMYKQFVESNSPTDWALGYFLFQESGETFTYDELVQRSKIAVEQFHLVQAALTKYNKKASNVSSNGTNPNSSGTQGTQTAVTTGRIGDPTGIFDRALAVV